MKRNSCSNHICPYFPASGSGRQNLLCHPRLLVRHGHPRLLALTFLLAFILLCSGCSSDSSGSSEASENTSGQSDTQTAVIQYEAGKTIVLEPEFDTADVSNDLIDVDFSHSSQGYFTCMLKEEDARVNIQISGPDGVTYKYFVETANEVVTFPLTAGDGSYVVLGYENIADDEYASLFSYVLDVELDSEFLPFLYPNQYVDFTEDSGAIHLAAELSENSATDVDALNDIYDYVISHIVYDDEKAATVETGYLPNIDETLATGTGICFDYAALTVAMLRSLSIPAKLAIGYSGDYLHAWIDVYIESKGWVENAIQFSGEDWTLLDPTLSASGSDSDSIKDYVGDGENYTVLYVR
ncbi:MAG: transglutaminase-like domain-containing protein [Lachnospiraceae bacterium]|nr:transglutaminase-like domain-containing protein [Lachnospiraceae bacterium]